MHSAAGLSKGEVDEEEEGEAEGDGELPTRSPFSSPVAESASPLNNGCTRCT
jgi:hypothetical protein